jgi:hydrogenase expression/formation protein HypD
MSGPIQQADGRADAEARRWLIELGTWRGKDLTFMEVCGTHTMAAARAGLRQLLPASIRLISGPGCPVCVTPVGYVDHAMALAALPGVTITTFGDLLRVPGSARGPKRTAAPSLATARAAGGDVRVVFSPLDALALARAHPERQVVFLGVGFETTAPTLAAAVLQAAASGLENFSMLVAAKTIPTPLEVLASSPELRLDGLLCPGHVSVVLGSEIYRPLCERFRLPCAIAGFEPVEMLRGLGALVDQVRSGEARVDNCYPGAVRPGGNPKARAAIERAFRPVDSVWRGLGPIPHSGLALRDELSAYDAARRFEVKLPAPVEPAGCRCGDVLRGVLDPADCPLFGGLCTPEQPQGACMVSSEGSCAARYQYRSEGG